MARGSISPIRGGSASVRCFCSTRAHGTTVTDVVRGIQGTFTNSPIWTPAPDGADPRSSSDRVERPTLPWGTRGAGLQRSEGLTVIWSHKCDVKPNWVNRYIVSKGWRVAGGLHWPDVLGRPVLLNGGGGAGGLVAESRTVVDGEQYAYAITYDQTSVKFSQSSGEGIVTASTTMSVFGSIPTSSANINIGSAAGTLAWDGSIHWIGFWDYVLPLNLIAEIQSRPFLLVARRLGFPCSSAEAPRPSRRAALSFTGREPSARSRPTRTCR